MKKVLLFLFLITPMAAFLQTTPAEGMRGRVMNTRNEPVPYAHVVVLSRLYGTITDSAGFFSLPLSFGDTLVVSHMGYSTRVFEVSPTHSFYRNYLEIKLLNKVYELKEVVIRPFPGTWEEFRYAFKNLKIDPGPQPADLALAKAGTLQYTMPENGAGMTLQGPITALYNLFSKEGKSRQKLAELKARDQKPGASRKGLDTDLIKVLTGITDQETLERFMAFCRMDENFISQSNTYEICLAILDCYREFSKS